MSDGLSQYETKLLTGREAFHGQKVILPLQLINLLAMVGFHVL